MTLENRRTAFNNVVDGIVNNDDTKVIQKTLQRLYEGNYTKAIEGVFKNPKPDTKEWEKAQLFKHNAERLATYKANRILEEIAENCTGTDIEKKEVAKAILNKYNSYQGTEYNTLMARTRSSKQLLNFEKTKHIYPNVEWIRTRSASPREGHLVYVGRIFSLDSPFLQENMPGSLYNCKCDLKQTREPATEPPVETVTPAKGLEGNPNTTGLLVTDKHPYFNVPEKNKQELDKNTSKYIRDKNRGWGHENLTGTYTTAIINGTETKIGFTSSGVKHVINDPFDKSRYDYKNMLIPFLPELIKTAKYVQSMPNIKPENVIVKMYHYLEIQLLGKPAYFNIRELMNGEHVLYAITDGLK